MALRSPERGRLYRRCGCPRPDGRRFGASCPTTQGRPQHGSWAYPVDLPSADGRRKPRCRSGFPTRTAAHTALERALAAPVRSFHHEPSGHGGGVSWSDVLGLVGGEISQDAERGCVQQDDDPAVAGDPLACPVQARGAGGEQADHLDHPAAHGGVGVSESRTGPPGCGAASPSPPAASTCPASARPAWAARPLRVTPGLTKTFGVFQDLRRR